jgi:ABC-type Fe3+ transport system permease subunit
MNLGDIYLKSAFVLLGVGFLLGLLTTMTFLFFRRKQIRVGATILGTLVLGLPLSGLLLAVGQTPLFRVWHRSQNTVVPAEGCLTYEPTFFVLHATYRMDRKAFDAWANSHPWKLAS